MNSVSDILNSDEFLNSYTDKDTCHSYATHFYNDKFLKFKNKKINLCEVGIYYGASLFLWDRYFEDATILGIDREYNVIDQYVESNSDRITHIFHDAYDPNFVNCISNFDIIIDDGPHTLESQKLFIKYYFPKLNDGGILIIEDVQDVSWFEELINETPEEYRNNISCIDLRHIKGRYDDLLFVITKN